MVRAKRSTPFIIGVAGGTASGKSLVTEKIMERLRATENNGKQVTVIPLESFYNEMSAEESKRAAAGEYDFDHPSAFDFDLLAKVLDDLEKGKPVAIPHYDFITNSRKGSIELSPVDVIIVEGILIFYDERVRNKMSMKLFVDADADIRLARRVRRDTGERKRPLTLVLSQYTKLVKPAFEEFCLPTKKFADVIIPRGGENDVAIDLLVQHIQDLLRTPRGSPDLHKSTANGKSVDSDAGDHATITARPH